MPGVCMQKHSRHDICLMQDDSAPKQSNSVNSAIADKPSDAFVQYAMARLNP